MKCDPEIQDVFGSSRGQKAARVAKHRGEKEAVVHRRGLLTVTGVSVYRNPPQPYIKASHHSNFKVRRR